MTCVCGFLLAVCAIICFAHYVAVAWPSIAYRPEIARPLRLDRPDSFGHCLMVALLLASTGASLLIYQLRRYRNDDFKGRYRLWRLVIIALFLASINAVVGIIDWGGAVLDVVFGKRVSLTGSEWIRIAVTTVAVVLAIRLIAEVRRCRASLMWMIAGWALLILPETVKWNALSVESLQRWVVVTCAPLLASTALFLSFGIYLRMLYREVRRIPDGDSMWERFQQLRMRWTRTSDGEESPQDQSDEVDDDDSVETETARGWFRFFRRARSSAVEEPVDASPSVSSPKVSEPKPTKPAPQPTIKPAKPEVKVKPEAQAKPEAQVKQASERRSILGWLWPKKRVSGESESDDSQTGSEAPRSGAPSKPVSPTGASSPSKPSSPPKPTAAPTPNEPDDEGDEAGEGDDWSQLNKSDRRRMRKQFKRQNRAA